MKIPLFYYIFPETFCPKHQMIPTIIRCSLKRKTEGQFVLYPCKGPKIGTCTGGVLYFLKTN